MKKFYFCAVLMVCVFGAMNASAAKAAKSIAVVSGAAADNGQRDWPVYNGSPGNSHYSSLTQINRGNVSQLKEVWRYDMGEKGGLETSPLIIHGVLYGYTPMQEVIALDGASGKLLWKFNSGIPGLQAGRGLSYWGGSGKPGDARILAGVMHFIYALDPATGTVIRSFGDNGRIDLREGLGRDPKLQSITLTSPGAIYKDLIIVGGQEPESLPAPPGDIRAYDVRTGKMRWSFHTIPHPGEFGYDTWPKDAWKYSGGANNWGGMAVDTERGIVYVPTGSAATDFYGANRVGDDLFANTLIALDAETGKRIWSFQGVRHDIWDRDFPAPPTLFTVKRDGKEIQAIAQTTKQGYLYLFNRVNGEPLFPIVYRKYPPSTVPGEVAAKEQPFPLKPAPYTRQLLTEDMLTNRTPGAHKWVVEQFRQARSEGQFVPLSVGKETIVNPGFEGGAEWGGAAVDPETNILYLNANDYPSISEMMEHAEGPSGRSTYLSQCSLCHGENRAGSPPEFPSLIDVGTRLDAKQIAAKIHQGGGRMPAFPNIRGDQLDALVRYLNQKAGEGSDSAAVKTASVAGAVTYNSTGYHRFQDQEGYPAVAPPWGTLNAINLNTGEYAWKIPLGQYPKLVAQGMSNTGTENYGGPVVTAGGLLFIGATVFDKKFHAFDKANGKLLWELTLPFPANATPATYMVDGRQYVVVAAGGSTLLRSLPSGGLYVAFALSPQK
jgi:quinoprotein glucose dehydrogenase